MFSINNILIPALILTCAPALRADEIRLKDYSVIKGTVTGIDAGVLSIVPALGAESGKAFKFKMTDIIYINTDQPLSVAGADGNSIETRLRGAPENLLQVSENNIAGEPLPVPLTKVWSKPEDDPKAIEAERLKRHWKAEVFAELTGKSGNADALGSTIGAALYNSGVHDKLKLYSKFNYSKIDGNESSNDLRGGFDYTWSPKRTGIYARSDNGFDKVKEIDFYSTDALGGNFKAISEDNQHLDFRAGIAYRYERFEDGRTLSGPGLDIGVNYEYKWSWGRFADEFTYTPVFDNFENYVITNDAFFEFSITNCESLTLRLGVNNNYESLPQTGRRKLDTTYFARIVYSYQ